MGQSSEQKIAKFILKETRKVSSWFGSHFKNFQRVLCYSSQANNSRNTIIKQWHILRLDPHLGNSFTSSPGKVYRHA